MLAHHSKPVALCIVIPFGVYGMTSPHKFKEHLIYPKQCNACCEAVYTGGMKSFAVNLLGALRHIMDRNGTYSDVRNRDVIVTVSEHSCVCVRLCS